MAVGTHDDEVGVLPQGEAQDLAALAVRRAQEVGGDVGAVPRRGGRPRPPHPPGAASAPTVATKTWSAPRRRGSAADTARRASGPSFQATTMRAALRCASPGRHDEDGPARLHQHGPGRHAERTRVLVAGPRRPTTTRSAARACSTRCVMASARAACQSVRMPSPALRSNDGACLFQDLADLRLVAPFLSDGVVDVPHQDGGRHLAGRRAREGRLEASGEAGGEAYPVRGRARRGRRKRGCSRNSMAASTVRRSRRGEPRPGRIDPP